jgi:predicted dehydrogenase
VGCGYWGPNLVRNLRQSHECQVKTVCDASEQRLDHMRRLYPGVATTVDYQDLVNDAELDAIVIATRWRGRRCRPASMFLWKNPWRSLELKRRN